eukprot:1616171-Rhodomonas_salina.1
MAWELWVHHCRDTPAAVFCDMNADPQPGKFIYHTRDGGDANHLSSLSMTLMRFSALRPRAMMDSKPLAVIGNSDDSTNSFGVGTACPGRSVCPFIAISSLTMHTSSLLRQEMRSSLLMMGSCSSTDSWDDVMTHLSRLRRLACLERGFHL